MNIDIQTILTNLRRILAEVYQKEDDSRRVAFDAGLNYTRINFQESAQNIWYSILDEAHNANKVNKLLNVALDLDGYKDNPDLRAACAQYFEWVEQQSHSGPPSNDTDEPKRVQHPRILPQLAPNFVGRDKYLKLFEEHISTIEPSFQVFIVSGEGGVGKTELLLRYEHIAREHNAFTVRFDAEKVQVVSILDILDSFEQQFYQAGYSLNTYKRRHDRYTECYERIENDPNVQKASFEFLDNQRFIDVRDRRRFERYIARTFPNRDDQLLITDPVKEFTCNFLQDFNELTDIKQLILFLDAYKYISFDTIEEWLHDLVTGAYGIANKKLVLVIAGRQPPRWHRWNASNIHVIELEVLREENARQYLDNAGIVNLYVMKNLLSLSSGLPLFLSLLSKPNVSHVASFHIVAKDAFEYFLEHVDSEKQTYALRCSIPRILNVEIINKITNNGHGDEILDWLAKSGFARNNGRYWYYHERARGPFLSQCDQRYPVQYRNDHTTLAAYYADLMEDPRWRGPNKERNPIWRSYRIEYLYHSLSVSPQQNLHKLFAAVLTDLEMTDFLFLEYYLKDKQEVVQGLQDLSNLLIQVEEETKTKYPDSTLTVWRDHLADFSTKFPGKVQESDLVFIERLTRMPTLDTHLRVVAHLVIAGFCINLDNKYAKALKAAQKVLELDQKNYFAHQFAGLALYYLNDYPDALDLGLNHLNAAISLHPNNDENYVIRSQLYRKLNDLESALNDLGTAMDLVPQNGYHYYWRGRVHLDKKNFDAAKSDFTEAIAFELDDSYVYFWRGRTYFAEPNYKAALKDFTDALIQLPKDDTIHFWQGQAYWSLNNYGAAIESFTQAINLQPDNGVNYFWRGKTYFDDQKYEAALKDFTVALTFLPKDGTIHFWQGWTYWSLGNYGTAIKSFTQAINYQTDNAVNYFWRGRAYLVTQQYDTALQDFAKALTYLPEEGEIYFFQGQVYWLQGNYRNAVKSFTQGINLQPDTVGNYFWRGRAYLANQNYEAALNDFNEEIKLLPDDNQLYYWHGLTNRRAGHLIDALEDFTLATAILKEKSAPNESTVTAFEIALYTLAAGNDKVALQRYSDTLNQLVVKEQILTALGNIHDYLNYFPNNEAAQTVSQLLRAKLAESNTAVL